MQKLWNVTINGATQKIEYKGSKILINGEVYKVKSQNWFLNVVDYPIVVDGTEVRVVAIGKNVRLAVNGIYEDSGEKYMPLNKVPTISNVFIAISCIGGLLLCGIFGMLVGFVFSQMYVKKGLEGKIGGAVGAFIGCTVMQLILMYVFNFM